MSTFSSNTYTWADWQSIIKSDGSLATFARLLDESNPLSKMLPYKVANDIDKHEVYMLTQLGAANTTTLNEGYGLSADAYSKNIETTSFISNAWEGSTQLLTATGDPAKARAIAARNKIESINQKHMRLLISGNTTTNLKEFNGLQTRYSVSTGNIGQQVIKGGGSGSVNTSIYFTVMGEGLLYGIHHANYPMGLSVKYGTPTVRTLANGNVDEYVTDLYGMHCGIALEDYRAVSRICNIDTANLKSGTGAADLYRLLIEASYRVDPVMARGKTSIHVSRSLGMYLDIQARDTVNAAYVTHETVDGKPVTMFRGIPIFVNDAITDTEATVS